MAAITCAARFCASVRISSMSTRPSRRSSAAWRRLVADIVAETERLILRTWKPEDRAEYARHVNTEAVGRFVGGVQSDDEIDAAFGRLEACQREHGHSFWAV